MKYPEYKTQVEIARERKERYEKDMNLDQPLTYNDQIWSYKEKKPKIDPTIIIIISMILTGFILHLLKI